MSRQTKTGSREATNPNCRFYFLFYAMPRIPVGRIARLALNPLLTAYGCV